MEMSKQPLKSAMLISEVHRFYFQHTPDLYHFEIEGRLRSEPQISIYWRVVNSDLKVVADQERSQI